MRIISLIKGDIQFQIKHGFYLIYSILSVLYIGIIMLLPDFLKDIVSTYIIFTDPVTAGLFFMGAIILFEKSQRVLNSLAVSPMKISEYIIAKVASLSLIALLVGLILILVSGKSNIMIAVSGILLGSALFTLISLIVAPVINSINEFILYTIPIAIICFIPSLYYLIFSQNPILLLHPCNLILYLIMYNGNGSIFLPIVMLLLWIIMFYVLAYRNIDRMFKKVGGITI